MHRKTAVVTGANSGIGLETARALARLGYRVVMLCRNPAKAATAIADIEGTVAGAELELVIADLGLQSDVRRAAAEIAALAPRLDVLVNNAGMHTRKQSKTAEGIDTTLAVNHLGPFLLTNLLLPELQAAAPSRVVVVASDAHKFGTLDLDDLQATRGYGLAGFPRYGETKLMNILFTRELARRLDGTGVVANSLHPGAVSTNIGNPPAFVAKILRRFFLSAEQGAATSVAVATDPRFAEVTGTYFVKSRPAEDALSDRAKDDVLAARLWDASVELTSDES